MVRILRRGTITATRQSCMLEQLPCSLSFEGCEMSETLSKEQCLHEFRPIDSSGQLACIHCNAKYRQELVPSKEERSHLGLAIGPRCTDYDCWCHAEPTLAATPSSKENLIRNACIDFINDYTQETGGVPGAVAIFKAGLAWGALNPVETPPASKEYLRWRKAADNHRTPWVLEIVRPDGDSCWTLLFAESPLEVRNAHETAEPQQLRDARFAIGALIAQAGGELRVTRRTLLDLPLNGEIETWDDPVNGDRVFRLKEPAQKTSGADDETPCAVRDDGLHCECWYGGNKCCGCGDGDRTLGGEWPTCAEVRAQNGNGE